MALYVDAEVYRRLESEDRLGALQDEFDQGLAAAMPPRDVLGEARAGFQAQLGQIVPPDNPLERASSWFQERLRGALGTPQVGDTVDVDWGSPPKPTRESVGGVREKLYEQPYGEGGDGVPWPEVQPVARPERSVAGVRERLYEQPATEGVRPEEVRGPGVVGDVVGMFGEAARASLGGQVVAPYDMEDARSRIEEDPVARGIYEYLRRGDERLGGPVSPERDLALMRNAIVSSSLAFGATGDVKPRGGGVPRPTPPEGAGPPPPVPPAALPRTQDAILADIQNATSSDELRRLVEESRGARPTAPELPASVPPGGGVPELPPPPPDRVPPLPRGSNYEPVHQEVNTNIHGRGMGDVLAAFATPEARTRYDGNLQKIQTDVPIVPDPTAVAEARKYGADAASLDVLMREEGLLERTVLAVKMTVADLGREIEGVNADLAARRLSEPDADSLLLGLKAQEFDTMGVLAKGYRELARALRSAQIGLTWNEAEGGRAMWAARGGVIETATKIAQRAQKNGRVAPKDLEKLRDAAGKLERAGSGARAPRSAMDEARAMKDAQDAARGAAPDPEQREFLDLLYRQRDASEAHNEAAVYAAQKRMDEIMDGWLAKAREERDKRQAEAAARRGEREREAVAEEGVDALRDPEARAATDEEKFDQRVMDAIQKRVQQVVTREAAPAAGGPNPVRGLVDKAFGNAYNTARQQDLAAGVSQTLERDLEKTLGRAWRQEVGTTVANLVDKLRHGPPGAVDYAAAETAIDEMVRRRPELQPAADRFLQRINREEMGRARRTVKESAAVAAALERDLDRVFGKALVQEVGIPVKTLVGKLKSGSVADDSITKTGWTWEQRGGADARQVAITDADRAVAEAAMGEMVRRRPDLKDAATRFWERIRDAEEGRALDIEAEAAGMESRTLRAGARERTGEIRRLVDAMATSGDVRAYAGRLLRELAASSREAKQEGMRFGQAYNERQVQKIIGRDGPKPGTKEHAAVVKEFARLDFTDPRAAVKFAAAMHKPDFWSNVRSYRVASMLTSPVTQEVNILGNALMTAVGPIGRLAAGASETALTLGGRTRPQEAYMSQAAAELVGLARGLRPAYREAAATWQSGVSARGIRDLGFTQVSNLPTPLKPLGVVFRGLGTADDFFRTLNEHMAMLGEAERVALQRGINRDDILLNLVDHPEVFERAVGDASRRVLQADLTGIFKRLNEARGNPAVGTLIPFLQTNANIYVTGVRDLSTPLGVIGAQRRLNAAVKAGDERAISDARAAKADANGMLLIGSTIMTVAGIGAMGGKVSGSGPWDPGERRDLMATGWRPYSVLIGDTWWDYKRWLGPLFIPIAIAANAVEAWKYGDRQALPQDKLLAGLGLFAADFGKIFWDQTGLTGLADFVDASYSAWGGEPMAGAYKLGTGLAKSFVPVGGLLATIARMTDAEVKDPDDALQAIYARIPELSKGVPGKVDVLGQPMRTQQEGAKALLPFTGSPVRPSPVVEEYQRLREQGQHVSIGLVGDSIKNVRLTPEQRSEYQQLAGRWLREATVGIAENPAYQKMPAAKKAAYLQYVRDQMRQKARDYIEYKGGADFGYKAYLAKQGQPEGR